MTIKLKLVDPISKIETNILTAIADELNYSLKKQIGTISSRIKTLIPMWISKQPEIQSLLSTDSNSLIGQFGITSSPSYIVNSIISSVVNSTSISFSPYNKKLENGGITINIQPDNFGNLLSLQEGHSLYSGGDLHWLDWLLNRGDENIVVGYYYNPQTGLGRSRLGNMKTGGSFRIPPEFSGTPGNNFITRALLGPEQENEITKIFKTILGA